MPRFPHCDKLFLKFFEPWYDDDDRQRKGFSATRPDLMQMPDVIGQSAKELSPLHPKGVAHVPQQITSMRDAASEDWKTYLRVKKPLSLAWVDAFDRHYDASRANAPQPTQMISVHLNGSRSQR